MILSVFNMSDKPEVTEIATVTPPAKRSCGAKTAAHFRKWWWVHVIIFIAVVLVVILPV